MIARAAVAAPASALIRVYQVTLSPLLGPACRFEPSCSRYMVGALQKYGLVPGVLQGRPADPAVPPVEPGRYDPP